MYGYRPIQTPGIEDTDLIIRTSGEGSDVVQKETYTFTDRGGRSLTLRPEGTAPICRAYVEHGLHREPQPQKLYTIGPFWRYDRPQKGRYREHWQLSVEAIERGSGDRRGGHPSLHRDPSAPRGEGLQPEAELDRRRELPSGLRRKTLGMAGRARRRARRRGAREARDSPLRVFDVKSERVHEALRDAPRIGDSLWRSAASTSRAFANTSTRTAFAMTSSRRSYAGSTTTRARRSSSSATAPLDSRDEPFRRRRPLRRPPSSC